MISSTTLTDPSLRFRAIRIGESDAEYITTKLLPFWQAIALPKKSFPGISEKEEDLFLAAFRMASRIDCQVDQNELKNPNMHLYLCRDQNNHPQALILFFREENLVEIETLLTNPKNIRSLANAFEKNKAQGAATFLLKAAESFAKKEGLKVELSFTEVAEEFYKRNGYKNTGRYGLRMVKTFEDLKKEFL